MDKISLPNNLIILKKCKVLSKFDNLINQNKTKLFRKTIKK